MNFTEAIKLRKQYIRQRFAHLNEMQLSAALDTEGPKLILAGAGSGKTTVIVNRICNLIRFGNAYLSDSFSAQFGDDDFQKLKEAVQSCTALPIETERKLRTGNTSAYNILAITFTNKAAEEMKNRIIAAAGEEGRDVFASTFHSACARFLRSDISRLGIVNSFTIYDSDDTQRTIKSVCKLLDVDSKLYPPKMLAAKISRLKDTMITPEQYKQRASDFGARTVSKVYTAYQQQLLTNGALDFDDLICRMVELLEQFPDVREKYNRRFRYILVDEYQDTSIAQYKLVELLTGPSCNVCVVGDDDQSIYRFRGATIENILSFEDHFPGATTIRLEQNYRSTSNILDCANSIIKNNISRKGKTLWTAADTGVKTDYYLAYDQDDEAAYVGRTILARAAAGQPLSDFAVLYRMNAQSNTIENFFARSGIPYRVVGGLKFFDRAEVKDILAYMSIVNNRFDNVRLTRIINRPTRKIGEATVNELSRIAAGEGCSMLDIVERASEYETLSRPKKALEDFYKLYEDLCAASEKGSLQKFVSDVIKLTGYEDMLIAEGDEGVSRLENIRELLTSVAAYCKSTDTPTIEEYLDQVALISAIDVAEDAGERVTLMTLHCAKGLEFTEVFIVGMEEGIFPSELAKVSMEDIEEERRLAYVGITRAKKRLTLVSCESRMLFGMTRRNRRSRFVDEIDPELLNLTGRARLKPAPPPYVAPTVMSAPTAVPRPAVTSGESFSVGDRVRHKVFGDGSVLSCKPIGNDVLVEVDFDQKGVKKMMQNYAPLQKI